MSKTRLASLIAILLACAPLLLPFPSVEAGGLDGDVWVNVASNVQDLGRCNLNGEFGDCSVARIYPHPGGLATVPGTYTAFGRITDSNGNDVTQDNSCSFAPPVTSSCNTDGQTVANVYVVTLFNHQQLCFGVHGVLREYLAHGGAVMVEKKYPGGCVQGSGSSAADTLYPGENILAGQFLVSGDGRFTAEMQADGNFVIYKPGHIAVWATNTFGHPGSHGQMQFDGNFVVVDPSGAPLWATNTAGHSNSLLRMQNDCNLVVYSSTWVALWASGTVNC